MAIRNDHHVFWETDVCLHYLQRTELWYPILQAWIRLATNATAQIYVSTMSLVEVARVDSTMADDDQEAIICSFFDHPTVTVIDATRDVAQRARGLVRRRLARPADALHLASAMEVAKIQRYFVLDEDILRLDGTMRFKIERPTWPDGQPELAP